MRGVERQRGAAFGAGAAGGDVCRARQLAQLAGDLPGAMHGDRGLALEAVAPHGLDRALEHEPGGRMALADIVERLAGANARAGPLAKRFTVSICAASSTGNI